MATQSSASNKAPLFLITILVFFMIAGHAHADYFDDLDKLNADIVTSEVEINKQQTAAAQKQTQILDLNKKIDVAQQIYDIGLIKYRDMNGQVIDIEKRYKDIQANLFVLRSTYEEFYDAYINYKNYWYAKNYHRMGIEYQKMWLYLNGPGSSPPYRDPVTAFYEVRKWFLSMASRWTIRTLHSVVSSINIARKVVDVKAAVTDLVGAAKDGIAAVLKTAVEQGIDHIEEDTIQTLKEAGASTSTAVAKAIEFADAVSDPLSAAEEELSKMVDRVEKTESFGYPSKEEAIAAMTSLSASLSSLHQKAESDAKQILDGLTPVKDKLIGYRNQLNTLTSELQTIFAKIKVEKGKIEQTKSERAKLTYTYHYNLEKGPCGSFVTDLDLKIGPDSSNVADADPFTRYQLSKNPATQALIGHPVALMLTASADFNACTQVTGYECQDKNGDTAVVDSYNVPHTYRSDVDMTSLTGTSENLKYENGMITPENTGQGKLTISMATKFTGYVNDKELPCYFENNPEQKIYSVTASGSGTIVKPLLFNTIEAYDFTLIPERYKQDNKPITETFPSTCYTFFETSETPYKDMIFYIAYKMSGSDIYHYQKPDRIQATETNPFIEKSGVVTGIYTISGYMKARDGTSEIQMGSITLYAEDIVPYLTFTNYKGSQVTVSEGLVPLENSFSVNLSLTSGSQPKYGVDDYVKSKIAVQTGNTIQEYEDIEFYKDNLNYYDPSFKGVPLPLEYTVEIFTHDGSLTRSYRHFFSTGFTGSLFLTDIYMTDPGGSTPYNAHKNLFSFSKIPSFSSGYDLYGRTSKGEVLLSLGSQESEILFDYTYVIGNQSDSADANHSGATRANIGVKLIGGQVTTKRDRVRSLADIETVNHSGYFFNPEDTSFVLGFNFNVAKLRMREKNGRLFFVITMMGPARFENYTCKWTFSDDSIVDGVFTKSGMTYESLVEPVKNLKQVEVFHPSGKSMGKCLMSDYITDFPTLYGIFEDQFTIQHIETFEYNASVLRRKNRIIKFIPDSGRRFDAQIPLAQTDLTLEKVSGINMITSHDLSMDGNTLQFSLGFIPERPLQVIASPDQGEVALSFNTISYTRPEGFAGIARFSVDLYGTLSNPCHKNTTYPTECFEAVEKRWLHVTADYSKASPEFEITIEYKSPINLDPSFEFDLDVSSAVNYNQNNSLEIDSQNRAMVNFELGPITGYGIITQPDLIVLNKTYAINITGYKMRYGAIDFHLDPDVPITLSRKYLMALFYPTLGPEIDSIRLFSVDYDKGFHFDLKNGDTPVEMNATGNDVTEFDSLSVCFDSQSDFDQNGLWVKGYAGAKSDNRYLWFIKTGGNHIAGDYNADGIINIQDLIIGLGILSGRTIPVNMGEDTKIDIRDALLILQNR